MYPLNLSLFSTFDNLGVFEFDVLRAHTDGQTFFKSTIHAFAHGKGIHYAIVTVPANVDLVCRDAASEEVHATEASQGVEVKARGSVPTHQAAQLFLTEHSGSS